MNARLWVFVHGGPVKITLRPGQSLSSYACSQHEEGWSDEYQEWHFTRGLVERTTSEDGTDCDGRHSSHSTSTCEVASLRAGPMVEGVVYPDWAPVCDGQRDYRAEAAGY